MRSRHTSKLGLLSTAIILVAGWGTATGCQARLARRPTLPVLGTQGSAWEAALPSASVVAALGPYDPSHSPEFARNDGALSPRPAQARLATRQWPEDPRPSLAHARRLQLETRPDQVLFFEPVNRRGDRTYDSGSGWNWWW